MITRRPTLRLPQHRGTTAHISSLYPFSVQRTFGWRGCYVGIDLLAGGGPFCWDPFEAYETGLITNPNCWIVGEPGNGKSALVKTLLWRMAGIWGAGSSGRWIAVIDPKGEYGPLAEAMGLTVIRLAPGGSIRVNPLSHGRASDGSELRTLRRAEMLDALLATVLERPLVQFEDAGLFWVIEYLTSPVRSTAETPPTLLDVARTLSDPPEVLLERLRVGRDEAVAAFSSVLFALDKLLSRAFRGMFDGPSTVSVDSAGPGLLIDLSAIPLESDALPLVMVAAAGWLSEIMASPGTQRVQVLDEAWALLGNRHTAAYLQTCFKLGRSFGVANICVTHRPSDLVAQADDGSATAKIAAGLLADSATKVILRQAPDQLQYAAERFGLTAVERTIIGQLARGRALWKVGARAAVVQHRMMAREAAMCDTDARMLGRLDTEPPR